MTDAQSSRVLFDDSRMRFLRDLREYLDSRVPETERAEEAAATMQAIDQMIRICR